MSPRPSPPPDILVIVSMCHRPPFSQSEAEIMPPDQLDVRTRGQDGADAGHYLTQYCDDQAR